MTRLLAAVLLGVAAIQAHAVETVDQVDLRRYLGTWYELAKLPNRFQSDCQGNTTAHYSMQENGRIKVVPKGRRPAEKGGGRGQGGGFSHQCQVESQLRGLVRVELVLGGLLDHRSG